GGFAVGGAASAAAAGRALRDRGVGTVIVTLGAQGSLACTARDDVRVPAFPVTAVDTTAAGDAFNGALGAALAGGDALPDALRFASAAAAIACTRRGAQPSLPTRDEVARLGGGGGGRPGKARTGSTAASTREGCRGG